MRAAGAAILGAAAVGALLLATQNASAAESDEPAPPDFDVDAEVALAMNYYANAISNPIGWSDGQLKSLEGLLVELGFTQPEASNIKDMRLGLYGDTTVPPAPLPDITFIPPSEIDAIADRLESDASNPQGST